MKRKLLLSAALSPFFAFGTFFFKTESVEGAVETVEKGFPFTFTTEVLTTSSEGVASDRVASFIPAIANIASWMFIILVALVFLDWLAGFVGKMIIRLIAGLAVAGYFIFVNLA